jgi:hypothetical protein
VASSTGTFIDGFVWESAPSAAGPWTPIDNGITGPNNSRLTLNTALAGQYVRAKRPHARVGDVVSDPYGQIAIGTVTIYGTPETGQMLNAYSSGTGFSGNYTWEYAFTRNSQSWQTIANNNGSLTIPSSLVNYYIRATRNDIISNILGPITAGPVPNPIMAGSVPIVSINGMPSLGATFTAVSTQPDNFTGNFVWEWAADASAETWIEITDGTSGDVNHNSELTIGPVHILDNKYVRVSRDGVHSDARLVNLSGSNPPLRAGESDRTYADAGMATVE